jgi:hypothetical protein
VAQRKSINSKLLNKSFCLNLYAKVIKVIFIKNLNLKKQYLKLLRKSLYK